VLANVTASSAQTPSRAPAPAPSPFRIAIDASAFAGLPRVTVNATDEAGHTNAYSGVALDALIVRAGAPSGPAVRGKAMMTYIVVGAADGYHALFTLAELDPGFTGRVILLADQRDGAPLPPNAGPYRIIVPGEKREARWVRQVTDIELINAPLP
jgi:hypothetical protein